MSAAETYRRFLAHGRTLLLRLPPLDLQRRIGHYARVAAGFFLTIMFLGAIGVAFMAAQSRVRLEPPAQAFAFEPSRSASLQAIEQIFAMRGRDTRGLDERRLFAPGSRRFREAQIQIGAESAALDLVQEIRAARGERNEDFVELRRLIGGSGDPREIAAAAQRLDGAIARGRVQLNWDETALRRLALKAAARLEARATEAAALTHEGRFGLVPPRAETAFFRARGEAYGWALLLRGAALDARAPPTAGFATALDALDRAASLQPLFLFNGPRDSAILPNHLAHVALDLELAANSLRQSAIGSRQSQ